MVGKSFTKNSQKERLSRSISSIRFILVDLYLSLSNNLAVLDSSRGPSSTPGSPKSPAYCARTVGSKAAGSSNVAGSSACPAPTTTSVASFLVPCSPPAAAGSGTPPLPGRARFSGTLAHLPRFGSRYPTPRCASTCPAAHPVGPVRLESSSSALPSSAHAPCLGG